MQRVGPALRWRALIDGEEAGDLKVIVRPDARCFASFERCRSGVEQALLAAVDDEFRVVLHVNVDENDETALRLYRQLGFVVHRRESIYAVPTDPATTCLEVEAIPGISLVPADRVDERSLRELDEALRQDVPGTDGWRWDEAAFREETFDPNYFDPTTYLVAVERGRGDYVGLARVWNNPGAPRLGLIAVLRRIGAAGSRAPCSVTCSPSCTSGACAKCVPRSTTPTTPRSRFSHRLARAAPAGRSSCAEMLPVR